MNGGNKIAWRNTSQHWWAHDWRERRAVCVGLLVQPAGRGVSGMECSIQAFSELRNEHKDSKTNKQTKQDKTKQKGRNRHIIEMLTTKEGHDSAGKEQQRVGGEKRTQRNIWVVCFPGQRQGHQAFLPSVQCMKGMWGTQWRFQWLSQSVARGPGTPDTRGQVEPTPSHEFSVDFLRVVPHKNGFTSKECARPFQEHGRKQNNVYRRWDLPLPWSWSLREVEHPPVCGVMVNVKARALWGKRSSDSEIHISVT